MNDERRFLLLGAIFAGLSVGLGAFGAHGLRNVLSASDASAWDTAARYQMAHGLGLAVVAWASSRRPSRLVSAAGWTMVLGIFLFSGSLYAIALTGLWWVGPITPFGGIAFMTAWALLAWAVFVDER